MRRNLPSKQRPRAEDEGCTIEIRRTRSGKKIKIGKNCSKDQIKMLQESGQISPKDMGED